MEHDIEIRPNRKHKEFSELAKLLEQGPRSVKTLSRKTGWKLNETQFTLLQMITADLVRCVHSSGKVLYQLSKPAQCIKAYLKALAEVSQASQNFKGAA
jgi:hypothetical protein